MLATKYRAARFVCTLRGCLVRVLVGVKNWQSTAVGIQRDENERTEPFLHALGVNMSRLVFYQRVPARKKPTRSMLQNSS